MCFSHSRALLSGTLLQTLPDLVTALKGYSLSPRQLTRALRKVRYYDCSSNLAPKHAREQENASTTGNKKKREKKREEFRLDSNDCGFICTGVYFVGGYKWHLVLFEFVTHHCLSTNKKLLLSWQFSGPYGVTKYGSGWRNDVVNQCWRNDVVNQCWRNDAVNQCWRNDAVNQCWRNDVVNQCWRNDVNQCWRNDVVNQCLEFVCFYDTAR